MEKKPSLPQEIFHFFHFSPDKCCCLQSSNIETYSSRKNLFIKKYNQNYTYGHWPHAFDVFGDNINNINNTILEDKTYSIAAAVSRYTRIIFSWYTCSVRNK